MGEVKSLQKTVSTFVFYLLSKLYCRVMLIF